MVGGSFLAWPEGGVFSRADGLVFVGGDGEISDVGERGGPPHWLMKDSTRERGILHHRCYPETLFLQSCACPARFDARLQQLSMQGRSGMLTVPGTTETGGGALSVAVSDWGYHRRNERTSLLQRGESEEVESEEEENE